MNLLVVVPAYNEEESIELVIENLRNICPKIDFLIVNDGSTDNTERICIKNGYPLLNLPTNLGLSGAFGAGMKYAYENGYDAVLQFDADGQHRPEYIVSLMDKLYEGNDIVIGSRFVTEKKPHSMRMFGSNLISFAILVTTKTRINDPTSGMRLYNKRMIREYATQINMAPEPDTISYLIKRGARIEEIQVTMSERIAGQSYLTVLHSLTYMMQMSISILLVQFFRCGQKFKPAMIMKKKESVA